MAVPLTIRRLVVEARKKGISISDASRLFQIGEATVKRIVRQWRETGALEPGKPSGRSPVIDDGACQLIQGWLRDDNDLTLSSLSKRLADAGYAVTPQAVFYCLKRMGWSYKKNDARKRARPG